MKHETLNKKVRSPKTLWGAWQAIRENGRLSNSLQTQDEIRLFDQNAYSHVSRIYGRLHRKTFKFDPALGVAQKKKGKTKERPIVIASVTNRVVQRAILDVIQSSNSLQGLYDNKYSFGGILKKGVGTAVRTAQWAVKERGASYFICSDISGFFQDIRRQQVVDEIAKVTAEPDFVDLFGRAITTELSNIGILRATGKDGLFPIQEIGVAQGCCLSPLIGNIYLKEFDSLMNTEDVFCLRYIDDFIILGPSAKVVRAKFKQGLKILKDLGLSAYLPSQSPEKASEGNTADGFDYLGCTITSRSIRPSKSSWNRMQTSIKESFADTLYHVSDPSRAGFHKMTFSEVIVASQRRLEGWVKQYAEFCDDERIFGQWHESLQKDFLEFENHYFKILRSHSSGERALALGLKDIKHIFHQHREKSLRNQERKNAKTEL